MSERPQANAKPIICLDFDGCIHSYSSGWKGEGECPDPPVPGVFEWIESAMPYFEIHIYSSRSSSNEGVQAMYQYIIDHGSQQLADLVYFADEKPHAFMTIDDRATRFNGDWNDPELAPQKLREFRPWYKSHFTK